MVDTCPQEYCSSVARVTQYHEMFEKGFMPLPGGVLDQSASFIAAVRQISRDDIIIESEIRKK